MGPDATNEEEEEEEEEEDGRTTEEGETKSRRISVGVSGHHANHQKIMVRAQYRPSSTTSRTKTHSKKIEATQTVINLYSLRSLIMPQYDSKYFAIPLEEILEKSTPSMLA